MENRVNRKLLQNLMASPDIDFTTYLESLSQHYAQWWKIYTLTDATHEFQIDLAQFERGSRASPFGFELMVERIDQQQEQQEKQAQKKQIERLPVLAGLRQYAPEHVLLIGRPGSGKSTALARLLLETATEALKQSKSPNPTNRYPAQIPVLVELRSCEGPVLQRIQAFLQRYDTHLNLDPETLKTLIYQGQFLLLFDGLNELPSEAARRQVATFRRDRPNTPMIFTTRALSSGGTLGIDKQLEMQPLNPTQMQQFVQAQLPQQGERFLQQLQGRLREFGQTPLLLSMLCDLFRITSKIPDNLGLVFRYFTCGYETHIKEDVPIQEGSRQWWSSLLQQLAAVMMQPAPDGSPVDLCLALEQRQVLQAFVQFLQGEVLYPVDFAQGCLEDLLRHHLIQLNGDQVEFRHQLLQEYYAAEWLLSQLPALSDGKLKRDYLNYLKWTEPIALMLALVTDEAQAIRIVKLALEVDLYLGTRLAGAVQAKLQTKTVDLLRQLPLSPRFSVYCLARTRSEKAIPDLLQLLENPDSDVRWRAANKLGQLSSEVAIPGLLKALEDPASIVRGLAAEALGNLGSKAAIPNLLKALEDSDWMARCGTVAALGKLGSGAAIPGLLKALEDSDWRVRKQAADALGILRREATIPGLLKALEDSSWYVRLSVAAALGKLGSEATIPGLLKALEDRHWHVRGRAATALGELGSEAAIPVLLKVLEDNHSDVRREVAKVLGELSSEAAVPGLLKALEDEDSIVCQNATTALGELGSEAAIPGLLKALNPGLLKALEDNDPFRLSTGDPGVRRRAAAALGKLGSEAAIPGLLKALEDSNSDVRGSAATALGKLGSEAAVPGLLKALEGWRYIVRQNAAAALGELGSEAAIPGLLKALEGWWDSEGQRHWDRDVSEKAAEALGKIGSAAIPGLLKALQSLDSGVSWRAAKALEKIGSAAIPGLLKALEGWSIDGSYGAVCALEELGNEVAIPGLINALGHWDSDVRWRAAKALWKLGSKAAVPGLLKALEDQDSDVRRRKAAAKALGEIGSENAIPGLLEALEDEDSGVRRKAVEALGEIGSENAIPGLLEALEDEDSGVRWEAAEALGDVGSENAIPGLLKALEDRNSTVRREAAEALGDVGSENAIPGLLKALEDQDWSVRQSAVNTLGKLGSEAVILGLFKALEHQNSDMCDRAVKILKELDSEAVIPSLLKALEHQNSDVRGKAVKILEELDSEGAIPGLLKALEDGDLGVQSSAAEALGKLGSSRSLAELWRIQQQQSEWHLARAIWDIQECCQFYNHEIAQLALSEDQPLSPFNVKEQTMTNLTSAVQRDRVFISYSHKDDKWRQALLTHLAPFIQGKDLNVWDDTQILPGTKWKEEIETALAATKVAVLLVSADFLASKFINEKELPVFLENAEQGGLTILWIPVRPSSYKYTKVNDYQAVHPPHQALSKLTEDEQEDAWVEICDKIQTAFER